jgi:hypothetical protein
MNLTSVLEGTTPRPCSLAWGIAGFRSLVASGSAGAASRVRFYGSFDDQISHIYQPDYMIHNRGSQDDWDNYARIAGGDATLQWNNILPLKAVEENFTLPVTSRSDLVSHFTERLSSLPNYYKE